MVLSLGVVHLVNCALVPRGHNLQKCLEVHSTSGGLDSLVGGGQVNHPYLCRLLASAPAEEDLAAPALPRAKPEPLVVLLKQELVAGLPALAPDPTPQLVRAVGLVLLAVKDDGVVEAPRDVAGGLLDHLILDEGLGLQIPEVHLVGLIPGGVHGVGDEAARWGGGDATDVAVRKSLRDLVLVQDNLDAVPLKVLLRVALAHRPAVELVGLPLDRSGKVPPPEAAHLPRNLLVGLLQVALHL